VLSGSAVHSRRSTKAKKKMFSGLFARFDSNPRKPRAKREHSLETREMRSLKQIYAEVYGK
jgi:hypothetical protein